MFWHQIVIAFTITIGLSFAGDTATSKESEWNGLWFPASPEAISEERIQANEDNQQSNFIDNEDTLQMSETKNKDEVWNGLWFPAPPGQIIPNRSDTTVSKEEALPGQKIPNRSDTTVLKEPVNYNKFPVMGNSENDCDNGITNLGVDYDPSNITHHSRHLCINERHLYAPSYDLNPRLLDYTIPPEYVAIHKCMDQEIEYDDMIPTFGTHRKLWPVYGEYVYCPPQRWIHSLEHGAIVFLYHPCANLNQLDIVKDLIKKCLYRHIITANDLLEPERPFALVAWGRSMEFSVADQLAIVSFIRLYALQGPEKIFSDGQYNQTLIEQSNIVTSEDDNVLCQNL